MTALAVTPASPGDVAEVQRLIESAADYAERVTGYPPGAADALSLLLARPEGVDADAKVVLVAREEEGRLVAVLDLIRGYPSPDVVLVGVLLVAGAHRRRGLGTAMLAAGINWIEQTWPDAGTLRVAVVDTNAEVAAPFLRSGGFAPTGEAVPYRYDHVQSTTRIWQRSIAGRRRDRRDAGGPDASP